MASAVTTNAVNAHNKAVVFGVYRDLLRAIGFAFKGAYAMFPLQSSY